MTVLIDGFVTAANRPGVPIPKFATLAARSHANFGIGTLN